jgi:hypothetical protein
MDAMVVGLVVNLVVERKVVKHGLFAFFNLLEVGIDRPVSRVRPGNIAPLWADFRATIAWPGRMSVS